MSIANSISKLTMNIDEKYKKPELIQALKEYHLLLEKNLIKPRENQLNRSGVMPNIVRFNVSDESSIPKH